MAVEEIVSQLVADREPLETVAGYVRRVEDPDAMIPEYYTAAHADLIWLLRLDQNVLARSDPEWVNWKGGKAVLLRLALATLASPLKAKSAHSFASVLRLAITSIIIWMWSRSASVRFSSPRNAVVAPCMVVARPSRYTLHIHHYVSTRQAHDALGGRVAEANEKLPNKSFGAHYITEGMLLPSDLRLATVDTKTRDVTLTRATDGPIVDLCGRYYDDYLSKRLEKHGKEAGLIDMKYGYADCALPLVLEHNTPNNAIPLLWAETKGKSTPADQAATAFPEVEAKEDAASSTEEDTPVGIVVTGSRLGEGFRAPTPVLADTAEQLVSTAPTIVEGVQFLPVFRNSTNPRTQSTSSLREQGAAFLNLRGLTPQRTLVLVNGRRYITSGTSGAVDINTVPQDIIDRVEIVTGGASAAYGSDAVAGVVNFILDNDFTGVRVRGQAGISKYGDAGTRGAAISAGTSFAGDRGHVIFSADYLKQDQVGADKVGGGRNWFAKFYGIIPSGTQRVIASPIVWSNATQGGLITTGVLANTQFLPGGVTAPFQTGQFRNANSMIGGGGVPAYVPLISGLDRWSVFGRTDFDLSDTINIWAEGTYAQSVVEANTQYTFINGSAAFTIFNDNAYLPSNVRSAMAAAGQTSFRMGRLMNDFGINQFYARSRAARVTAGFDWDLGADWQVSAYYMYGRNKFNNSYSIQKLRELHER